MSVTNPFLLARNALVTTIDRGRAEGWVISSAAGLALDAPTLCGDCRRDGNVADSSCSHRDVTVAILWLLAAIELDAVASSAARCLIRPPANRSPRR